MVHELLTGLVVTTAEVTVEDWLSLWFQLDLVEIVLELVQAVGFLLMLSNLLL